MDDTYYSIKDLDRYADAIRNEAATRYDSTEKNNLDEFITLNQIKTLVESHSLGLDENEDHIINEETHIEIVDEITNWIFNVGLAKLAASNKIECAWDNSLNDMVFWLSDNSNKKDPTNDTKSDNSSKTRNR